MAVKRVTARSFLIKYLTVYYLADKFTFANLNQSYVF